MLPGVEDWLSASWTDYRRRWLPLMGVLALSGLATAAAVFLPLFPAGLAAYFGIGSPWLVWGAASVVSLLAGMWMSAWAQAAALRAAANDEAAAESLRLGWRQTPAFAWVVSLVMLAAGGGFVLLVVPGLALCALLFFAPYYQMAGEASGMDAVGLSWARVKPVFGPVCGRLFLLASIVWLPSWIPLVGWLLAPLWAPFGLVAGARLAADLKASAPEPERPRLGAAVGALGLVFCAFSFAVSYGAARSAAALYEARASGRLAFDPPDAATGQSLIAVLQGSASDDDRKRSLTYVLSLSSPAKAAP